jgi:Flp pilus assembly pilin Flp
MAKKHKTRGVTIVEYAIMLALIAIAVAVTAPNITSAVVGVFGKASSVMNK